MKGLLGQPEYATGLLGAATANPNMARQFANARQNMAAPTSVMDERYPAWKKSQDQAEQFLLAADFVSSAIPAAVMAAPYAKKGLLAAGKTLAPKVENYMARTGLLQPATVWHGSPHRFDKFDASKIGTGEGAQAYGHGLYFAENPSVANSYKPKSGMPEWKGKQVSSYGMDGSVSFADGTTAKVLDNEWSGFRAAMEGGPRTGSLYKVDLPDEAIAKMLDWDKPLSQQAPEVQSMVDSIVKTRASGGLFDPSGKFPRRAGYKDATGADVLNMLRNEAERGNIRAENLLKDAGIPGIRYLDGGSRGTGAGTSNYVVFPGNESLLKILSRE